MEIKFGGKEFIKVLQYYNLIDNIEYYREKFKILCPFHEDIMPSMLISLDRGSYYCFGCGKSGDVINFVANIIKRDKLTAISELMRILKQKGRSSIKIDVLPKKPHEELLQDAKEYFYSLSKLAWEGITSHYMLERGFTYTTLENFDVRINQNSIYPTIIPLKDMNEFVGYVCRAHEDIDRKYLYNEGFIRRKAVIGKYNKPNVLIVEGIMDLMKTVQFGIKNSCAIMGWRITTEQVKKIKQYTDSVICGLDNTESGLAGFKRLKQFFGQVVRFQYPENTKDIGEMDYFDFKKSILDTYELL